MSDKINVVIVEPHHHALEHIHHIQRLMMRKQRKSNVNLSWTMVHFDSHPDLAMPNDRIPARLCYNPREIKRSSTCCKLNTEGDTKDTGIGKDLYELLDTSQSGIAEWIIPLVLAGGLEKVYWIKNDYCDQFHCGTYNIPVGAWINSDSCYEKIECFLDLPDCASIKTSVNYCYYLDDESVVPEEELLFKKELKLIVSDLRESVHNEIENETISLSVSNKNNNDNDNRGWILDVCLDYFICANPFITDLETIDSGLSVITMKAFSQLSFRKNTISSKNVSLTEREVELYKSKSKQFQDLTTTFFRNVSLLLSSCTVIQKENLLNKEQYEHLYKCYDTVLVGKKIWDEITISLVSLKPSHKTISFCDLIINSLPNFTLPHQNEQNQLFDSQELSEDIVQKVQLFGDDLRFCRFSKDNVFSSRPSIVTIARSSDDGFTPCSIVDQLQRYVLNEIHNVYCDCKNTIQEECIRDDPECNIKLILDYGEHEGSTIS